MNNTNVTVNCAGFSITGNNSTSAYGIYVSKANTTIKNCQISNWTVAVYTLGGTTTSVFNNNTITNASLYGFQIAGTTFSNFTNNNVQSSGTYSVFLTSNALNNNITNITVNNSGTGHGIYVNTGSNNNFIDCQGANIVGNNATSSYGIYSSATNTTMQNCNISNFADGITISGGSATILNNNLSSTRASSATLLINAGGNISATGNYIASQAYRAVGITGTINNITIANNILNVTGGTQYDYESESVTGSGFLLENNTMAAISGANGIYLYTGSQATTMNNNTILAANGISIPAGSNHTIDCKGATMTGYNTSSTYGILISVTNTTIRNCIITNYATGLSLASGSSGNIVNNITANSTATIGNTGYGINIVGSNQTVTNSSGFAPAGYGINLQGTNNTLSGLSANGSRGFVALTAVNCSISNSNFSSPGSTGAYMTTSSIGNTFNNITFFSNTGWGLEIGSGSGNTIANSSITDTTGTNPALWITS